MIEYKGGEYARWWVERRERLVVEVSERIVHKYISVACLHDRHDECRRQCPFCEARCLCWHHEHSGPQPDPLPGLEAGS